MDKLVRPTISIILITKNAAAYVRRCLESVRWADEIIVLDSGSSDDTVAICQEYTDNVHHTDWPGFGQQKNRALAKATSTWVFSIDADEWVSEKLHQEIVTALTTADKQTRYGFWVPRLNNYFGQWVHHGDVGKDRVLRLFKRNHGQFSDSIVHERLIITPKQTGHLKNPLLHEAYRTLEELLERLNRYSSLSAQMRYKAGKRSSLPTAIAHGFWAFLKSYFLRFGFLDGKIGLIIAIVGAQSSYYRHLKLVLLQENSAESLKHPL